MIIIIGKKKKVMNLKISCMGLCGAEIIGTSSNNGRDCEIVIAAGNRIYEIRNKFLFGWKIVRLEDTKKKVGNLREDRIELEGKIRALLDKFEQDHNLEIAIGAIATGGEMGKNKVQVDLEIADEINEDSDEKEEKTD